MAKTKAPVDETKPVFDVSKTDKRNDKRVILDYVTASRYAPELLPLFDRFGGDLDAVVRAVDEAEGGEIHTAVDTAIAKQVEDITRRWSGEDAEYADYGLRGNGVSFFLPKASRNAKTFEQKAEEILNEATPEQVEALKQLFASRGIEM
jgi:hypothetical protein